MCDSRKKKTKTKQNNHNQYSLAQLSRFFCSCSAPKRILLFCYAKVITSNSGSDQSLLHSNWSRSDSIRSDRYNKTSREINCIRVYSWRVCVCVVCWCYSCRVALPRKRSRTYLYPFIILGTNRDGFAHGDEGADQSSAKATRQWSSPENCLGQ